MQWFEGRTLAIATMHQKERVLGSVLQEALGVQVLTPAGLNTDVLGTFTGEVERQEDIRSVLRTKCRMAMDLCRTDLAVASEGSFGPHPQIPFVPADDEALMLLDLKNGLEIHVRELSFETNYASGVFTDWSLLEAFARSAGFPEHGIILRTRQPDDQLMIKGITNPVLLREGFNRLLGVCGEVHAETDMRAMFNPTRMRVIERAARKLADRVCTICPGCARPGFGLVRTESGLPCSQCFAPTRSVLLAIYGCDGCGHIEKVFQPEQKQFEDPMYCSFCNP